MRHCHSKHDQICGLLLLLLMTSPLHRLSNKSGVATNFKTKTPGAMAGRPVSLCAVQ
jgi:hypothetical protein